jgi:predicted phosphate transport protein (TIGR00153 family)
VFKKQNQFFDLLVQITENISAASAAFKEGLKNYTSGEKLAASIKVYEDEGDEKTHQIIRALNATYMTPIEREDILALATKLDDILDGMEAAANRFDMFHIQSVDNFMVEFAKNIQDCAEQLEYAMKSLQRKKLLEIRQYTVRLNELENVGDKLMRDSIKSLFARTNDPVEIIKLKEVYEILEGVSDSCEDVADILESVVMTNA